ncbi:Protein hgh1 [Sorochytrium milnesiophthora]
MSQLDELVQFLDNEQDNVRLLASEYIMGMSVGESRDLVLAPERIERIVSRLALRLKDEPAIAHNAAKCLVNLSSDARAASLLNRPAILNTLIMLVLEPRSVLAELACMLLSNVSQVTECAHGLLKLAPIKTLHLPAELYLVEEMSKADRAKSALRLQFVRTSLETILAMPTAVDQLVEVFNRGLNENGERWYNANADFGFLAGVFANLSKTAEGRRFFLEPVVSRFPQSTDKEQLPEAKQEDNGVKAEQTLTFSESDPTTALTKLLCYTEHPALIRRGGIVSMVKNLTFSLHHHDAFVDSQSSVYILQALVTPLAPGDFADRLLSADDDVDLDAVPDWLLSLPATHFVEQDHALKRCLLEALLVLTSTLNSRAVLRAEKVYYVLREYHKTEQDHVCRLLAERCVDMLMRDDASGVEDIEALLGSVAQNVRDEELEHLQKLAATPAQDADKQAATEDTDDLAIEEIC